MSYIIQVRHTGGKKPWYWRVVSANHKVLLTSETYVKRGNARNAAWTFYDQAWWGKSFVIEDKDG